MRTLERFRADLYLFVGLVPKVLLSNRFRVQLDRHKRLHPEIPIRMRLTRRRNWGTEWSIALSPVFSVPIGEVFPQSHPEVEACLAGRSAAWTYAEQYYVRELGWTVHEALVRVNKTFALLEAPPGSLYSEIRINSAGKFVITDGYHRAGISKALGLETHRVRLTVKVYRQ
jgi:hypothetical protein